MKVHSTQQSLKSCQRVKVFVGTGSSNNSHCESGTSGSLNDKMRTLNDVGGNYTDTASQEHAV